MAANDNVTVRIVGDASGVAPAVQQAGGDIGQLEPILAQLNEQLAVMTATMREAFIEGGAGAERMAQSLHGARAATEAEGNALTRMVMKVHEGAESDPHLPDARQGLRRGLCRHVRRRGVALGRGDGRGGREDRASRGQARHDGARGPGPERRREMSGTNIDVLAKALGLMDNKAVIAAGIVSSSAAKAFKAMGIDARDGSTNMERLLKIADNSTTWRMARRRPRSRCSFSALRAAMIPFLNQGSAAIQQLMQKSKELGAVNEGAVEQGARLASSVNESKVAWAGLKNTLTEGFGPAADRACRRLHGAREGDEGQL
jgi:hypothetical protein